MPHRPIGSRWRCTHAGFNNIDNGDIVTVVRNTGGTRNIVARPNGTVINGEWSLSEGMWVEEPADAAPPADPAPVPVTRFVPHEDERYIILYRNTVAFARDNYGTQYLTRQDNFTAYASGAKSSFTLAEAERIVSGTAFGTNYDCYIVPIRAVGHFHNGRRQPFPVEVVPAAPEAPRGGRV